MNKVISLMFLVNYPLQAFPDTYEIPEFLKDCGEDHQMSKKESLIETSHRYSESIQIEENPIYRQNLTLSVAYDLEIDSYTHSLEENIEMIKKALIKKTGG